MTRRDENGLDLATVETVNRPLSDEAERNDRPGDVALVSDDRVDLDGDDAEDDRGDGPDEEGEDEGGEDGQDAGAGDGPSAAGAEDASDPARLTKNQARRQAQREARERTLADLDQTRAALARANQRLAELGAPAEGASLEETLVGKATHGARRTLLEEDVRKAEAAATQAAQVAQAEMGRFLKETVAAGAQAYSDWDDKMTALLDAGGGLKNEGVLNALSMVENPAQVLHHLGSHPDQARRILGSSPDKAAFEIGKISQVVSIPQPKPQTSVKPSPKVRGGAVRKAKRLEDLSDDEYEKVRLKQMRQRR